ncbi:MULTISPECIES: isopentenyl-diphosphate Delta-isomerase [unclassified Spirosoma]|uniref:isopentenyl-diphosphate Delta-isomerase n=1 Tax=unclassified Spirosoma TaxID=2621999 RepID=UPI000AAA7C13|nr:MULTISPECIES: isopentenyl-diphosphate Delta-isomerase [unclassified Spirosoma]MBN8821595.1 isopentenyl-diphosphate Delta-isomerase [Spirosoma sp.]
MDYKAKSTQVNMVLVVDEQDHVLTTAEKWQAHADGLLHRAFSVQIFNQQGDFLLQQRAFEKYHSGGLWSNSCCGHPLQPSDTIGDATRRLEEELGFQTTLQPVFTFQYRADVGDGLIENEIDHVFTGVYEGPIPFNPQEVSAIRWVSATELADEMTQHPSNFTVWFRILFEQLMNYQTSPAH